MSVISGHLIFTGFRRLTGCQQDPRDRGVIDEGVQNYTRTLYLHFQTFVVPSLITESKYHI